MAHTFDKLAIGADELIFGTTARPLERNGVRIGGGKVVPEIKFTLPATDLTTVARDEIRREYTEMVDGVCQRAVDLHHPEIIVEFEHLPPMTEDPLWGADLTALLRERLDHFAAQHALRSLLRVTPVDIRETDKPPLRRGGAAARMLLESFSMCAASGADLLSIESTGGKEVADPAIMAGDIQGVLYGLAVLGVADMRHVWGEICHIAEGTGTIAAGDTACGFGNTAMMLADQGYVPKVFASAIRAMTTVRSLVAFEMGAMGPGKDCGYENIFIKAITGLPISLEGRSAAGAHMSSIGNISGAYADAWSNESIPNIKLLSGMAPVVSMEQLIYDCRLFNTAVAQQTAGPLREMLIASDAPLDPQAYIFRPDSVAHICGEILRTQDPVERTIYAGLAAISEIRRGVGSKELTLAENEIPWLDRIASGLEAAGSDLDGFLHAQREAWKEVVAFNEYGLE